MTLAHHVEKAVDNKSDVDCVTYHAIVLDSVLCQSPRHTRQANEIHALTILFFLNTQYCVTGRNRPNRIRFIKIVVISRLYRPLALRPVTMVMEVKRRSALYIGMGRNSLKTEPTVQAFYQPTLLQLYLSVNSEPVGLPTIVETLPGCCYRRSTGRLFR